MEFEDLKGKTLTNIAKTDDSMTFTDTDGKQYQLYHSQDCCEHVRIEDIEGDLNDLIGHEILLAEEVYNSDQFNGKPESYESFTWTFYKLATIKGYVTIRWLGESNGYYSESVGFYEL